MEAWPVPPLPDDIVQRKIRYAVKDNLARPFVPLASDFRGCMRMAARSLSSI